MEGIRRAFEIELDKKEELTIVRKRCKENRLVVEILLEDEYNGCCPFPGCCSNFPKPGEKKDKRKRLQRHCATLTCNADVCSGGYAYRMT